MKRNKIKVKPELVESFIGEFGMSTVMATLLIRRGVINKEELPFYFCSDENDLHQPFLFKDMGRAIDRILRAKEEGERVIIQGDKDVDGIVGTTIIVKALQRLGIHVEWQVPTGSQSYSFSKEDVQKFHDRNISLIITIDCGISNHQEIVFAESLGIDVLIFDHHTPGKTVPEAHTVINAKIKEQGYPFKDICAGALAVKLYQALLFSQTEWYQQDICLLNIVPLNTVLNIEIICVRNVVVKWKKTITVSDELDRAKEELLSTVADMPIYVYNAPMQKNLMYTFLGNAFDVYLVDIKDEWQKYFPQFMAHSLIELKENKNLLQFYPLLSEIDLLYKVYTMVMNKQSPCLKETVDEVFDLAAISTVADIMPLRNENRIIVQKGLLNLQSSSNIGLNTLFHTLKLHRKTVNVQTISWKISPVINASGRMGQANLAVQLFLEEDGEKIANYIEQLIALNKQRISQMDVLKEQIYEEAKLSLEKYKQFIIIYNENIPHSFTGAFANTVLMKYDVPSIIITKLQNNILNASIRCEQYIDANDLIEKLRPLLIDGGGHKAAAGFSFDKSLYQQVMHILQEHIPVLLQLEKQQDTKEMNNIDLEMPEEYFNINELKTIVTTLAPFGTQWPPIILFMKNITLVLSTVMGDSAQHLKMTLKIAKYHVPAIVWNYDKMGIILEKLQKTEKISFLSTIHIDEYNGKEQFTLIIKEIEY